MSTASETRVHVGQGMYDSLLNFMRQCFKCGSMKTYANKQGWERWYKEGEHWKCQKCYLRTTDKFRIRFDGVIFHCKKDPRRGICGRCGRALNDGISVTYLCVFRSGIDPKKSTLDEVLKVAEELCFICHKDLHPWGK